MRIKRNKNSGWSFYKNDRFSNIKEEYLLGPGYYDLKSTIP